MRWGQVHLSRSRERPAFPRGGSEASHKPMVEAKNKLSKGIKEQGKQGVPMMHVVYMRWPWSLGFVA